MTRSMNPLEILRARVPFSLVPTGILETVAHTLSERFVDSGNVVLSRISPLQDLLIVLEGKVDIVAGTGVVVSLVSDEAFPLEVLQSENAAQVAGCDYIANGHVRLLVIPGASIARLRAVSAEFNDFCIRRSVVYQQRSQTGGDVEGTRNGLNLELSRILPNRSAARLPPDATVREAVQTLHQLQTRAVAIVSDGKPVGVFTSGDLVSRVLIHELDFDTPVADVMTRNPVMLTTAHRGFDAVVEIARCGVRHIVLQDQDERFAGVVSDSDLLDAQQNSADLRHIIANAESDADLVRAASRIRDLVIGLVAEGVEADHLTRLVSALNDRLVERIVEMESTRADIPMDSFCWIGLGSEGRHEQTLHTDQDNALVFVCADPRRVEERRREMIAFARKVNEVLSRCGFPWCAGNVMASNPQCCLTPAEWRTRFSQWIDFPTPEALLNATIHFDMRSLCGNHALCNDLTDWLTSEVQHSKLFFHLLTENALQRTPPIGLFRDFVVDKADGCLDIKIQGITTLVDGARILGLAAGSRSSSTVERFRAAGERKLIGAADLTNSIAAFGLMQKLRLRHHNAQFSRGEAADNRINPYALNNIDRRGLLESLRHASSLQKAISRTFTLSGRM